MNLPSTLRASSRSRTLGRAPSASSIALILSSHHPHLAPLYILTTPIPATSTYVLTADSNMRVVPRMRAPAHGRRDHRLLSSPLFFFVFFNPRISVTIQVYLNPSSPFPRLPATRVSLVAFPSRVPSPCGVCRRATQQLANTVIRYARPLGGSPSLLCFSQRRRLTFFSGRCAGSVSVRYTGRSVL